MSQDLSIAAALEDLQYVRERITRDWPLTDQDLETLLVAAEALAVALQRVRSLETSRIGADDYLTSNGLEPYSFYQGVSFALARVQQAIKRDGAP